MDADIEVRPQKRKMLPPVQRHPEYFKDPYKNSPLMTFNLQKQRDKKLKKIM